MSLQIYHLTGKHTDSKQSVTVSISLFELNNELKHYHFQFKMISTRYLYICVVINYKFVYRIILMHVLK